MEIVGEGRVGGSKKASKIGYHLWTTPYNQSLGFRGMQKRVQLLLLLIRNILFSDHFWKYRCVHAKIEGLRKRKRKFN